MAMTDVAERRKRGQDKAGGWGETVRTVVYAVLIAVVVRTFAIEPFNIPSGSMIPTLVVGDFILVNKFTYGIRLPVINRKIIEIGAKYQLRIVNVFHAGDGNIHPILLFDERDADQTRRVLHGRVGGSKEQ